VFRTGKAIPVASKKDDPAILEQAFEKVAEALANGELVAIFPEGRITDTGELYPFRPGIRRIVERTPVPVIPLALKGLWGSFFSRVHNGRAMRNPLRNRLFAPIALVAAPAMSPEAATPEALQSTVAALRGDWR
jgi:1-acyl-sn-glycerol-3-phosphate acyltransferase